MLQTLPLAQSRAGPDTALRHYGSVKEPSPLGEGRGQVRPRSPVFGFISAQLWALHPRAGYAWIALGLPPEQPSDDGAQELARGAGVRCRGAGLKVVHPIETSDAVSVGHPFGRITVFVA